MDHLQACYFCGAAEDEPLREVTVTPRSRRDDPEAQVSLTLCRSCEKKLERVLDGLFEYVESGRSADREAPTADDDPAGTSVDQIDVGTEPSDEATSGSTRSREADATADNEDSVGTPATQRDGGEAAVDGEEEADHDQRVTARATMNSTEGLEDISVEDYNRVMRLLQNRELPMEREAFVVLATNAYELHEDEVQALLDEVIESGKLAERDDELVRPEDQDSP